MGSPIDGTDPIEKMSATAPMLNLSRFDLSRLRALRRFKEADRRMQERVEDSARVICIASGKGGTGKSILATNLAVSRAKAGERVLLVDFDAGLANADSETWASRHNPFPELRLGDESAG